MHEPKLQLLASPLWLIQMMRTNKKIIVFDLDETLIHATKNKLEIKEDFRYEDYYIYQRPFVDKFLSRMF